MNPGRVVAGRYQLLAPLGSGGVGTVWLAQDQMLSRRVAVKEFAPPAGVDRTERELLRLRTLREARTAARLSHPNVVTIYDVVEDDGRPWIVMEFVPAQSLRDLVREHGPLAPQQAATVGMQVLAALRAAHDFGILHRDVKPGNVLIDSTGRAVLADFGIAQAQDSPALTATGVLLGSPSYMSPERARGEPAGPEADLWSLGATLYAIAEGHSPYDRGTALATLTAVVTQSPDPPRRCGALWPVISGLLRKDPARRLDPGTVAQMLRRIADDAPLAVPLEYASPGRAGPGGTSAGGGLGEAVQTCVLPPQGTGAATAPWASPHPVGLVPRPAEPISDLTFELAMIRELPSAAPPGQDPADHQPADHQRADHQRADHQRADHQRAVHQPADHQRADHQRADHQRADRQPPPIAEPSREGTTPLRRRLLFWLISVAATVLTVAGILFVFATPVEPSAHPVWSGRISKAGKSAAIRPREPPTGPAARRHATPPGAGQQQPIPAGYHRYQDPTGFSIAVPDSWSVSHQGDYVFLFPPGGARFLAIGRVIPSPPDPLADLRRHEANWRTYSRYHRIRLGAIRYPQAEKAAELEFTYYRRGVLTHVLIRLVLASAQHAYVQYWSTPGDAWDQSRRIFNVLASTFQPASPLRQAA